MYIEQIKNKIKGNVTIVLPETEDERIINAAQIIKSENLINIILVGKNYLDPAKYENIDILVNKFLEVRGNSTFEEAKTLITTDYMYFSVMLVLCGYADAVVSGACHSTADTLRPALQLLKKEKLVSSFFIIESDNTNLGHNGILLFSDSALIQNPTADELVIIAKESYESYKKLIGDDPKIAMLSHSTLGSAKGDMVDKVSTATKILKENYPYIYVEGEIQADAALRKEVARIKGNSLSGAANILIFPNIDAGNIAYKLIQIFGNVKAYGPFTQGLMAPVNDLSRGCTVDEIVATIILTAYQVQNKNS